MIGCFRCPLGGELGEEGSYLAHLNLDEYGPCVTLTDEADLRQATDSYSIAAIKVSNASLDRLQTATLLLLSR